MHTLLPVCLLMVAQAAPESAAGRSRPLSESQVHMGSSFTILLHAPDEQTAKSAFAAAFARIAELDDKLSDFDSKSELSRLSAASGDGQWRPASDDLWRVLDASVVLSVRTEGAFDVSVGALTKLWRRARRQKRLPPEQQLKEALAAVGYQSIEFDKENQAVRLATSRMRLDLGGIAKGYAADAALAAIKEHGVSSALVNAGGDIAIGAPPPDRAGWRIGVVPLQPKAPPSRFLVLSHCSVATSGDAWQSVEIDGHRYSHLINPRTGLGLTERIAVTIIASDCTAADSLASAVSVLGKKAGLELIEATPDAEALIVEVENDQVMISQTKKFPKSG